MPTEINSSAVLQAPIGISATTIGALYVDNFAWLVSLLKPRLACRHVAADLAQDAFVALLANTARVPLETLREPRAYLTTVAQRLLANHFRRQSLERAYRESLSHHPEAMSISAEDQLIILETLQRIDRALDLVPDKARLAFLMAQFDGLTYREIAVTLRVHERTVKRYMAQAYEQCLRCLW